MLPKTNNVKSSKYEEEEKVSDNDKSKGGILGMLGFKKNDNNNL